MSMSEEVVGGEKPTAPRTPGTFVHPSQRKMFDKNMTFEEYIYTMFGSSFLRGPKVASLSIQGRRNLPSASR